MVNLDADGLGWTGGAEEIDQRQLLFQCVARLECTARKEERLVCSFCYRLRCSVQQDDASSF